MKCDELKARTARSIADEEEMLELGADCQIEPAQVYIKSEADNVIADLEESHKMEVEQLLMEIAELKDKALQYKVLYKEKCRDINTQERFFAQQIAHQKYKRCLDQAKWCERLCFEFKDLFYSTSHEELKHAYNIRIEHYSKWHKRWLELAEKFKETK